MKIKNRKSEEKKYLIVVGGPTASGKTEFAIRLALHFNTHIISCDSRQFFREMNIGTAKPSIAELEQAPQHFINNLSIEQEYSVGDYEREALASLGNLFQTHDILILTGGSGLYIKALCEGLDKFPEVPHSIRREVEALYQNQGIEALQQALAEADPEYYREVDLNNPHRLIRALAVCRTSGQPFSSFRTRNTSSRFFTPIYLQIDIDRQELYNRINQRVDQMIESGLVEEARKLYPFKHLTPLQTVGYQELFDHFDGKISLEEAVRLIKRNTRHYAKRQLTWLRRDGFWKKVDPEDVEGALKVIEVIEMGGG